MALEAAFGADQFRALARRLKEAGDKGLERELYRGISRGVQPLKAKVMAAAEQYMPTGYGPVLSRSLRVRTSRRTGRDVGITVVLYGQGKKKRRDVVPLNQGRLRHPLFGLRKRWYVQKVRAGFWDDPVAETGDQVKKEVVRAIEMVAAKIAEG